MSQGYPPQPGREPGTPWGATGPAHPPGYVPPATTYPGAPPPGGVYPDAPPPDNYLVWAILSTVFCCFLAGIPALLAATSVNERWLRGDQAGAREASLRARNWTIGAIVLGVIFWTTWMLGVFLLGWKDTLGDL